MLLQGLKVIEMATWVAGPGCAAIMADWGADVIKIESPTGDPTRTFFPDTPESPGNPIFTLENRGKRGVVFNITLEQDRQALLALLKQADIFVTNLRPGALKRAGLDYDTIKGEAPRLIYGSISGYGLTGPEADLPAFDITGFWSKSGVAWATIPPDQEPFPCRPGFGDHTTALATLSALLAALHERHATGRGRLVETCLLRTGAYAIGWDLSVQLRYGEVTAAQPRDDRPGPISGYFQTADRRWICVVPRGPDCFPAMMRLIGRADLVGNPRYEAPITDLDAVREIRALVDAAFARFSFDEAAQALTEADLIWAPLATLGEMAASEQAKAAGCFETVSDGQGGVFPSPAAPARFPEGAPPVRRAAPKLGEHTAEVIAELRAGRAAGLTAAEPSAP